MHWGSQNAPIKTVIIIIIIIIIINSIKYFTILAFFYD